MNQEDFLLSVKENVDWLLEVASGNFKILHSGPYLVNEPLRFDEIKDPAEQLRLIKHDLEDLKIRVKNHIEQPDKPYQCGYYLVDADRQYGYSFEQLECLLNEYETKDSIFFKKSRGFISLIKWLYEVGHTSIGDLHGDMPKHAVVTFHRPEDFKTDEEYEIECKRYDAFLAKIKRLFYAR